MHGQTLTLLENYAGKQFCDLGGDEDFFNMSYFEKEVREKKNVKGSSLNRNYSFLFQQMASEIVVMMGGNWGKIFVL